ncbi:hypothetical protein K461DRAFT_274924 [Myriangium duriaei CBS 260.36]|uniref:Uncharacterized protein n=1 Tax=Myriangium duriaei CBS 260.36 TaxID=1168546 RepID=A0A9P4J6B6_9PEZI|nr:hypothetical protein K461DRAFT_274924 [Myriangium duriaei CBS 260.36]
MLRTAPGEDEQAFMEVNDFRVCLVDHMRWIERETGWATEHRVQDLIELWDRR